MLWNSSATNESKDSNECIQTGEENRTRRILDSHLPLALATERPLLSAEIGLSLSRCWGSNLHWFSWDSDPSPSKTDERSHWLTEDADQLARVEVRKRGWSASEDNREWGVLAWRKRRRARLLIVKHYANLCQKVPTGLHFEVYLHIELFKRERTQLGGFTVLRYEDVGTKFLDFRLAEWPLNSTHNSDCDPVSTIPESLKNLRAKVPTGIHFEVYLHNDLFKWKRTQLDRFTVLRNEVWVLNFFDLQIGHLASESTHTSKCGTVGTIWS